MSSILTNNSAMVALQTLKSINSDLNKTQEVISTGKEVGSAKDNAAVWAISKVMESDVAGFEAISDSLALGESTVAVARNASETVQGLLEEVKSKIVASQEENVDRDKIQTDIEALRDQITSVVGAAQFNGLNLIDGEADNSVSVLSSLNRAADGTVSAGNIEVSTQDLSQDTHTAAAVSRDSGVASTVGIGATEDLATFDLAEEGKTYQVAAGVGATTSYGGLSAAVTYVAGESDTIDDINAEMVTRLNVQAAKDGLDISFGVDDTGNIEVTNNTDEAMTAFTTSSAVQGADDGSESTGEAAGQLDLLAGIEVTTSEGAEAGLAAIESLIEKSIDAAASFGSAQKRIGIQNDFVGKLTDSLKSGIGSLVDADMEETSARLQALQVQQQLGVQSLSIANQAPQTILSLFR